MDACIRYELYMNNLFVLAEVLEESLREKFAPRADVVGPQGYDSLTVKMFDQLKASKDDRSVLSTFTGILFPRSRK